MCELLFIEQDEEAEVSEKHLLAQLRQKAENSKFEINPRLDFDFISRFLRVRNYDVDKSLVSLQNYYWNLHRNREWLANPEPKDVKRAFYSEALMFLKGLSKGRRVVIFTLSKWDPKQIPARDLQICGLFQTEYVSMETSTQNKGVVVIVDYAGLTLAHLCEATPAQIKRNIRMIQDGLPGKISEIHIVNPVYMMWPVVTLGIKLLKKKLRDRINIHYQLEILHKFVDRGILPGSLGGELKDCEAFDFNLIRHILNQNISYEDFWTPNKTPTFTYPVITNLSSD